MFKNTFNCSVLLVHINFYYMILLVKMGEYQYSINDLTKE